MDFPTLSKLGAVLQQVEFSYRYQKFIYTITANADAAEAAVRAAHQLTIQLVDELEATPEIELRRVEIKHAPQPAPQASDNGTDEFVVVEDFGLVRDAEDTGKLLGDGWKKWGVRVWPEVMDTVSDNWRQWPITSPGKSGYGADTKMMVPPENKASRAIVLLKEDGKPDKVVRFE